MTVVIPLAAAIVIGTFLGWLLTVSYATAAISRAQERMQRRVRYWQAQTARARESAARRGQAGGRDRWPDPDTDSTRR